MTLVYYGISAQENCSNILSGKIIDEHDGSALAYAEILIVETGQGAISDSLGGYTIKSVCPGEYLIRVYHLGCETTERNIKLSQSIYNVNFYLEHHEELLQEIVLVNQKIRRNPKKTQTLDSLEMRSLQTLGLEALDQSIAGYRNLSSGNNILKPMIHGLYGNRVVTSVNGIPLEDQQWGREHGLNIDPATAGDIAVVSGAAAVEYGPGALGGVLLISPAPLPTDSVLRGELNLSGQSNGRGGGLRLKLEQALGSNWSVRTQLGVKRFGDLQAPKYMLSNTGFAGFNYLLEAGFKKQKWQGKFNYQGSQRELGILRASSTGNITDLEEAIQRAEPLYQDDFSYEIASPRQDVGHHSLSTNWYYRSTKDRFWHLVYGFQHNRRKEYDFRRGISDNIPANDLRLITHSGDLKYHSQRGRKWIAKYGISGLMQVNTNISGTGIRPILPNYNRYRIGAYTSQQWELSRWIVQSGLRYDYEHIWTQKYNRQNELLIQEFPFHNLSLNVGTTFRITEQWQFSSDLSLASRAPHVIELLSEGLHHGAASIELGDSSLMPEYSLNWSNTIRWSASNKLRTEVTAYINPIHNYIFQVADSVPQLTIRGAFPVWRYVQTEALIAGIDLNLNYHIHPRLTYKLNTQYLRGYDLSTADDLILMPPFNFNQEFRWQLSTAIDVGLMHQLVARQEHYPEGLDLIPPPAGYQLLHLYAGWTSTQGDWHCSLQVRNLTNTSFRDYLDRFRYFADRPGINLFINVNYQF